MCPLLAIGEDWEPLHHRQSLGMGRRNGKKRQEVGPPASNPEAQESTLEQQRAPDHATARFFIVFYQKEMVGLGIGNKTLKLL